MQKLFSVREYRLEATKYWPANKSVGKNNYIGSN